MQKIGRVILHYPSRRDLLCEGRLMVEAEMRQLRKTRHWQRVERCHKVAEMYEYKWVLREIKRRRRKFLTHEDF